MYALVACSVSCSVTGTNEFIMQLSRGRIDFAAAEFVGIDYTVSA